MVDHRSDQGAREFGVGSGVLSWSRNPFEGREQSSQPVLEGATIPPGSLVAGVPGKVRRELTAAERERVVQNATGYVELTAAYRAAEGPEPP